MKDEFEWCGGRMCVSLEKMQRSSSPQPLISRALFKNVEMKINAERSKRPSIEEDYDRVSSVSSVRSSRRSSQRRKSSTFYTDSPGGKQCRVATENEKENFVPPKRNQFLVPPTRPRPRGLSERDTNVFRYSNLGSPCESICKSPAPGMPRINVCNIDEDDVFFEPNEVPPSSRLLLTPSTTYSPRPSSCTSLCLEYSPNIALGIQCNTPSRLKLEMEGLGAEKLVLGRGAYGTVVLGQWRGQKCAVKVMEKEEGGGVSARRRKSLESELQALKLDHDNIVKVHGVFATEERYAVIIMEYVGSRNLHRLLIETRDKYLGRSWLLGVARQISSALKHCHSRGVVHMDIKPANMLITSNGSCKLGDFGCSVGVDSGDVPLDHSLVGTPGYQAPEFLRGGLPHPAVDIYALGILFWQLDAREVPFQGQHPQTIMFRTVSFGARPSPPSQPCVGNPDFMKLYQSCWSPDPAARPSAATVHTRLCNLVSTLPTTATTGLLPFSTSSTNSNTSSFSRSGTFSARSSLAASRDKLLRRRDVISVSSTTRTSSRPTMPPPPRPGQLIPSASRPAFLLSDTRLNKLSSPTACSARPSSITLRSNRLIPSVSKPSLQLPDIARLHKLSSSTEQIVLRSRHSAGSTSTLSSSLTAPTIHSRRLRS